MGIHIDARAPIDTPGGPHSRKRPGPVLAALSRGGRGLAITESGALRFAAIFRLVKIPCASFRFGICWRGHVETWAYASNL